MRDNTSTTSTFRIPRGREQRVEKARDEERLTKLRNQWDNRLQDFWNAYLDGTSLEELILTSMASEPPKSRPQPIRTFEVGEDGCAHMRFAAASQLYREELRKIHDAWPDTERSVPMFDTLIRALAQVIFEGLEHLPSDFGDEVEILITQRSPLRYEERGLGAPHPMAVICGVSVTVRPASRGT